MSEDIEAAIEIGTGNLAAALAAAQGEIRNPKRNREVTVQTRAGGKYKFRYATLDAIIDCVRGPLSKNGLWFTQAVETENGKHSLLTRLLHSSGEAVESRFPLSLAGTNQEIGGELTYKRRYALSALLAVAADEDNNAEPEAVTAVADVPPVVKPAPDFSAPPPAPSAVQAALQPVSPAPAMLNVAADEIAAKYNRDVKTVRKEIKQLLKAHFADFDFKTLTAERTEGVVKYLVDYYADTESGEGKDA